MLTGIRVCVCLAIVGMACAASAGERTAWTTSRVVGTPEPPLPFKTERVYPNISFDHPVLIAYPPGIDRMVVGEQAGKLWSFALKDDVATKELVIDLKTALKPPEGQTVDAFYGLAFDPAFAENRYVYLCYVLKGQGDEVLPEGSRVSRFRMTQLDPPQIDAGSETVIISFLAGGHNGGCLEFGPDKCLYITTGDGAGPNPPDQLRTGQDCSDLLSSILRIDVHKTSGDKQYAVPADNPFVARENVRPEIWAFGFRNPWKMTFDRKTGELWVADVGWDQWEMVHWVGKGGNYGWSAFEGRQPILPDAKIGPSPVIPPLIELPHAIAASVTGGYVYRGSKFPELRGEYIFGDWESKLLWTVRRDSQGLGVLKDLADTGLQIVAFGEDPAGELVLTDYGQGVIHTLVRNENAGKPSNFPRKLSKTGLFTDVKQQQPAKGVLAFEVNQPQWSDYAAARRWLAMPGTDPIVWHPADVPIPNSMFTRQQEFPAGTVLTKTLTLEMEAGKPASARKIETQLLHYDGRDWRGYSYAWNDDQTDAELVPAEGQEKSLVVQDERWAGGKRIHQWSFTGRRQCLSCHTPWAQQALAFNPAQLNRTVERDGQPVNQLAWLEDHGVYSRIDGNKKPLAALDEAALAKVPKLAGKDDPHATNAEQARSYLHVNCSHCHRFNGGGAGSFELLLKFKDDEMHALDELPRQGNFDIPDARIIVPGDPAKSLLYLRMAKFGRGRMPHLASEYVDEQALSHIEKWIAGLGTADTKTEPPADPLASLETALMTARKLGRSELPPAERDTLLAAAVKHSSPVIQDLFSGYQPPERRRITLGSVIRPETILQRTGDVERGEKLFWLTAGMQCRNCHKVGEQGGSTGPELRESSEKRTRVEILENLLDPSKVIDRKYVTYVVQTDDGKVITGLLVRQDAKEVVLRDAQGKDISIPRNEVEVLQQSPKSLMPEGMLRDLTAQEAADLLDYLVALKTRTTPSPKPIETSR